jgi:hypothetical protein
LKKYQKSQKRVADRQLHDVSSGRSKASLKPAVAMMIDRGSCVMDRRRFLSTVAVGLAAAGIPALLLRSDAMPTPRSHDADDAERLFGELAGPQPSPAPAAEIKPTTTRELGPFYRRGAPYRAKLTPPLEPGTVLLVTGRIWSFASKRPLAGAMLDLWQVDNQTRDYSNGGGDFKNRARLLTDENGNYEFETIHLCHINPAQISGGRRTYISSPLPPVTNGL